MARPNTISVEKLARLLGTPAGPALVDVRTDDDFGADPRLIPGAMRRPWSGVAEWAADFRGRSVITICQDGQSLSHGVAAWLRCAGLSAEALDGGVSAWTEANQPRVPVAKLPSRDARGRTLWVTRVRPKVDRIACAWLIRRFVDPQAVFLFVPPSEVAGTAERFGAAPFDIDDPGVFWSHRGPLCTFDVMIEEFGLAAEPLLRLATLVRGADTARLGSEPNQAIAFAS